jgi:hypothetical protein
MSATAWVHRSYHSTLRYLTQDYSVPLAGANCSIATAMGSVCLALSDKSTETAGEHQSVENGAYLDHCFRSALSMHGRAHIVVTCNPSDLTFELIYMRSML